MHILAPQNHGAGLAFFCNVYSKILKGGSGVLREGRRGGKKKRNRKKSRKNELK